MKFWNWLSGKKTTISAVMMLVAGVVEHILLGIWDIADATMVATIHNSADTLTYVGMAVAGLGLGHKGVKQYTTPPQGRQ